MDASEKIGSIERRIDQWVTKTSLDLEVKLVSEIILLILAAAKQDLKNGERVPFGVEDWIMSLGEPDKIHQTRFKKLLVESKS